MPRMPKRAASLLRLLGVELRQPRGGLDFGGGALEMRRHHAARARTTAPRNPRRPADRSCRPALSKFASSSSIGLAGEKGLFAAAATALRAAAPGSTRLTVAHADTRRAGARSCRALESPVPVQASCPIPANPFIGATEPLVRARVAIVKDLTVSEPLRPLMVRLHVQACNGERHARTKTLRRASSGARSTKSATRAPADLDMTPGDWAALSRFSSGEWVSDAQIDRLQSLGLIERVFGQPLLTRLGRSTIGYRNSGMKRAFSATGCARSRRRPRRSCRAAVAADRRS